MMVTQRSRLEWYPPEGLPVTFTTGKAAAYRMLSLDGIGPIAGEQLKIRSPGQVGASAVDSLVPPRVVTLQALVQAASNTDLWPLRSSLARALVSPPVRSGEAYRLGRLRLVREGVPSLELEARPISVDMPQPRASVGVVPADIEWEAPYPYWTEVQDTHLEFVQSGGFEFEIEFGLEMESNNIEQEVNNQGHVDAPILARLYGDVTTARLINVTTGEVIEVEGAVAAGDYIEINTAFGMKKIELVESDGTRTSIMDRLNLASANFWRLRPGINLVRFEADVNVSGRADVYWRQRYGGV